ncbi:aldose 1-epimerase [Streptomyces sp. SID3343]|nr:aldose 1-epimerase [Streptomyces sp. SID3343]
MRSEGVDALILPGQGCRLGSLRAHGLELLRTSAPAATDWGSYPMVPWAGRMGGARLSHGRREHVFPADAAPHAIHGLGYRAAWRQIAGDAESASFELLLADPWPFAGRVEQTFTVLRDGLVTELRIESTQAGPSAATGWPAQAGWHPWFRRELGVGGPLELSFAAAWQEERGADHLPTGRRMSPPTTAVGFRDDCFGTPGGLDATLTWPGALRMRMTSDCDYTVVYDMPRDHVCVEPQTGPPNGLATLPRLVEPGRPLSATTAWTWVAAPGGPPAAS